MRPRCDEHLLPPGITFRCEPATLAPGAKGDLVIGFDLGVKKGNLFRNLFMIIEYIYNICYVYFD